MRLSVIIPTFNSANTLDETLKSVVSQNYQDIQIVIQDGLSIDNTKAIVEKYPIAMTGWQSEPDNGIYDAMNKGFKRATGEIIAILNSDDTWLPGALERVVSVFSRNPDVGIISGAIEVWEDLPNGAKVILGSSLLHLHKGMTLQHPATFVRRSVYEQVGFFNTCYRIGADYDFVLRCLMAHIPWIILDDVLVRMRAGGKGGTIFTIDDWRIRRSRNLSSVVYEICICTNRFMRHLAKQAILSVLGERILSICRNRLWRKRIYR